MIETQDHDQGQPTLYVGRCDNRALVLIDGHRWAWTWPGGPLAYLLAREGSAGAILPARGALTERIPHAT